MILKELEKTIHARQFEASSSSWTAKLLAQGPEKCAEKFGEEAIELVLAAKSGSKKKIISETADLFFHLLVTLEFCEVKLDDVFEELKTREGISGIDEKNSRVPL